MKFRTKVLGAVAALFMVAGPAQAQVTAGGNGALLIAIWDGVKSVVVDLNRTTNTATGSTGATLTSITTPGNTFTFDLSSILTAAGINLATANYMVFASDTVGGIGASSRGLVSTVNSSTASPTLASANVKGAADYVGGFITAEMNGTCSGAVSCAAAANTDTQYWGAGDVAFSVAAWAADAAVGTQLQLFSFLNGSGSTTTAANSGYSALLSATGELSISAVPLPAAGWLLLSGLGALAASGRRRRRQAAAV
jgi:hypothetical protein